MLAASSKTMGTGENTHHKGLGIKNRGMGYRKKKSSEVQPKQKPL